MRRTLRFATLFKRNHDNSLLYSKMDELQSTFMVQRNGGYMIENGFESNSKLILLFMVHIDF